MIEPAGAATQARRPAPVARSVRPYNGPGRALAYKRTRCQLCGGKGHYRAASGATVDCKRIGEPGIRHRGDR